MRIVFFLLSLFFVPPCSAYDREILIVSSRPSRALIAGKQTVVEVRSQPFGPIASITSDRRRSATKFHFAVFEVDRLSDLDASLAIQKLGNISGDFDGIGFPQVGMVTVWNNSVYGLVMLTTEDRHPSLGVGGAAGGKFGGLYSPGMPLELAALVNLDGEKPLVLKVYEFQMPAEPLGGYGTEADLQTLVAEYSYSDLRTGFSLKSKSCESELSPNKYLRRIWKGFQRINPFARGED